MKLNRKAAGTKRLAYIGRNDPTQHRSQQIKAGTSIASNFEILFTWSGLMNMFVYDYVLGYIISFTYPVTFCAGLLTRKAV